MQKNTCEKSGVFNCIKRFFFGISNPIRSFFSVKGVFKLKNVAIIGMMLALGVILDRLFSFYPTPTFRILSFSYLPGVIVAMLFGPWAALIYGLISDTLKFAVNPHGFYFFGYAISEMLMFFIYACFLYKRRISFFKVLFAKIIIMAIISFGLNFVWNSMMYGTAASKFFTGGRLINNAVQLPFHTLLTLYAGEYLSKIFYRFGGERALGD